MKKNKFLKLMFSIMFITPIFGSSFANINKNTASLKETKNIERTTDPLFRDFDVTGSSWANFFPGKVSSTNRDFAWYVYKTVREYWTFDKFFFLDPSKPVRVDINEVNNEQGYIVVGNIWFGTGSGDFFSGRNKLYGFKKAIYNTKIKIDSITAESPISDHNVYDVDESDLSLFLFTKRNEILQNFPSNLSESDINVSILERNGTNGSIKINLKINNILDVYGESTIGSINKDITITGLRLGTNGTTLNWNGNLTPELKSKYPSDFLKIENQLIFKKFIYDNCLDNKPKNGNASNNYYISNIEWDYNDLTGTIILKSITVTTYLDDFGTPVTSTKKITTNSTINISGLQSKKETAITISSIDLSNEVDFKNYNANTINIYMLSNFIYRNKETYLQGLTTNFTQNDISIEIVSKNPINGELTINVSLSKSYNKSNGKISNNVISKEINVSGLSPTQLGIKTRFVSNENVINLTGVEDIIPSSFKEPGNAKENILKKYIYNNCLVDKVNDGINGNGFNIGDLEILADNINGRIMLVSITLKKYLNENDEIVDDNPVKIYTNYTIFSGFKTSNEETGDEAEINNILAGSNVSLVPGGGSGDSGGGSTDNDGTGTGGSGNGNQNGSNSNQITTENITNYWWFWLSIGLGGFIIILIITIIIVKSRKKANNLKKKKIALKSTKVNYIGTNQNISKLTNSSPSANRINQNNGPVIRPVRPPQVQNMNSTSPSTNKINQNNGPVIRPVRPPQVRNVNSNYKPKAVYSSQVRQQPK